MSIADKPPATTQSDLEEVCRLVAAGQKVTNPELLKRIHDRSERARQEVFERNGLLDISVPYIRALRDGEDACRTKGEERKVSGTNGTGITGR